MDYAILCLLTIQLGPVGWGLQNTPTASQQKDKTPLTSVLDMILNNLMVGLQ